MKDATAFLPVILPNEVKFFYSSFAAIIISKFVIK